MTVADSTQQEGPSSVLEPGATFGRYDIVRMVGRGAMSEVYEVVHQELQKRVALKVLRADRCSSPTSRARFLREGRAAARFHHPNVVDISDVGTIDDTPYLVMELLDGEALDFFLEREKKLDVERAVNLMLPVLSAVHEGHQNGVVHRDLKPENIFLATDGKRRLRPKVLDFGISKLLEDSRSTRLTLDADILGTPHYMAPEQALGGGNITEHTDQYALGVILYEMVTGQLPHDGSSMVDLLQKVAYSDVPPPRSINPALSEELEAVLLRAMQRTPAERFESVRHFALALLPFASEKTRDFWWHEWTASESADEQLGEARVRETAAWSVSISGVTRRKSSGNRSSPGSESGADASAGSRRRWVLGVGLIIALLTFLIVAELSGPDDASGGRSSRGLPAADPSGGPAPPGAPSLPVAGEAAPEKRPPLDVKLTVVPDTARIELDGRDMGVGKLETEVERSERVHRLKVTADGHHPQTISFRDEPPPSVIALEPMESEPARKKPPRRRATGRKNRPRAASASPAAPAAPAANPTSESSSAPASPPVPAVAPTPRPPRAESSGRGSTGGPARPRRTDNRDPWLDN